MVGSTYYAANGGIAVDGSITQAQLSQDLVQSYNDAYNSVLSANYYTAQQLLTDQHNLSMENLSVAVDSLVEATTQFATITVVAEMAAEVQNGTVQEQMQMQDVLASTDMTISEADVNDYNSALADVEKYAQEAAGFLAAANTTAITGTADAWADNNNVSVASYTSVTYDATSDLLFMSFATDAGSMSVSFASYLANNFVTAEQIYDTGIAYSGNEG